MYITLGILVMYDKHDTLSYMKLYNSLSKQKEEFIPLKKGNVGMYHCGPTVYDYVHIGNLRSFMLGDFLRRSFEFLEYEVTQVMNITDIGHLVSDGDEGDDKMTKALKREDKEVTLSNMLSLANTYAEAFVNDLQELNVRLPHHLPRASKHIDDDIRILTQLEKRGMTYTTSDGLYFDTGKAPDYGKLGGVSLNDDAESRITENPEKKQASDFALWKFDDEHGWDSPWGKGFPGWHIECSGMGIAYLGEQFDIHTGGADLKDVHHNNEIAQSEYATGSIPFVSYWLHGAMLNFNGAKLSKSTGGNINLTTLREKNIDPLAYRYLALQTHYRSPMNFSWKALEGAQKSLRRIQKHVMNLRSKVKVEGSVDQDVVQSFTEKIEDDLNLPQALAIFHQLFNKNERLPEDNLATILHLDEVLGFDLYNYRQIVEIPQEVQILLTQRREARSEKNWQRSDEIRELIREKGFLVTDKDGEQVVEKE